MAASIQQQGTSIGGVFRLLGRLVAIALAAAAGVAGWIGAERYVLAEVDAADVPVDLPELGRGLPTAHLDAPAPWRQFQLTYSYGTHDAQHWFDVDAWRIRTSVLRDGVLDEVEIEGNRGYRRTGPADGTGEWVEQDIDSTRSFASFILGGVGPFVLTDLVPPNALGFTSLELEGTSRGERVYEVSIDSDTLRLQDPLAYERWVTSTGVVTEQAMTGTANFRVRVREDGYIVQIKSADVTATWAELPAGVPFTGPLTPAVLVPTTIAGTAPTDPAAQPTVPVVPVTTVPPVQD